MTEWQKIETAPRDGVRILTFVASPIENNNQIEVGYFDRLEYPDDSDGTWRDDGEEPTHWMSLPEPPNE